ncbi:hypothetical protein [Micromonospora sp. WMMD987]|jgi:hypothetical protein|uniref:hypothetical protein n=1 Tax=Micromonospora TaxID=1873 RepID=UPI00249CCF64|nr:hypothetical protein [Micromonospora sp. WMMD987]WFE96033.1 hypothetical protein O7612_03680 [Micromonospora sp. WMMD987]
MRLVHKILAATAVTGATAVTLLAGAAPASAVANGVGYYSGYGSGPSSTFAVWSAENDAKWKAQLGGFNPIIDCRTIFSSSTKISDYTYTANVQLLCSNAS